MQHNNSFNYTSRLHTQNETSLFAVLYCAPEYTNEEIKKKLCFSETLLVSCMHNKKIQPPVNKNIASSAEYKSEEISGESLDEEEVQKSVNPILSDDDFFFYFYDKPLPDKDKLTEYDNLMNINGVPTLNPNRKKVRCTCSKDNWKAVCKCGDPSKDELPPVPDVLSMSSESVLSEEVDIYDRKKSKQCRCSSTGTIMDECKCGAELDRLKRKSLPKIKRITIDIPEASSTNEGSLEKTTYSLSGEDTLSLTTQSSLSVVTRSEMSEEKSSPVTSISLTTESSLSILTNRKKVRCTCSKDNWKAVCKCGDPSKDELSPVPNVLSMSSESELSEEVDIYDRKKLKQCRCSSTGTIMDGCKCGAELDRLKRKSVPKIKRITIDIPEASSTNEGSLEKATYSLSREDTLSLTTQSSLSVVTRSEMSEEKSSPVTSISLTTESSLSILTPDETGEETDSSVKISKISFELDDFGECLKTLITPENCITSGGMTISVETIGVSHDKFLVHMTSQYTADGYDTGTELLSKVDLNLHTMEENKAQYKQCKNVDEFFEKELYVAICEGGYFCSTTVREGDSKTHESKYISYDDAYNFVLDGPNIILLRYLALTQFEGKLTTTYTDIGGNIGESSYVSKIVPNVVVNNQEMPVLQVGRVNLDGLGYETSECYVFTLLGYLVQHQWSYNNIVVHINPLLPIDPVTNQICRQIPLRNNWQDDMQILSNYLDFKDRRLMENESYLAGKVQLQSILTDYYQTILLMKPRDVVPFTKSFFASFDKSIVLPHNSYFDKHCQRVRYSSL